MDKKLVIGILAHVDAGKTTLTEGLLYQLGKLRKMGRVDHGDAFLDTHTLERERGITIFSKQALFELDDMQVTLLDTPGHTDFSAETERTLSVLDYCILVVSGTEGVQAHTRTLWNLLATYRIPTFVFVNKMDRDGADRAVVLEELQRELSTACIAFEIISRNKRKNFSRLFLYSFSALYCTLDFCSIWRLLINCLFQ